MSISFDRSDLDLAAADELLNGASLRVKLLSPKDVEGQSTMFDESSAEEFDADCPRLTGVSPSDISVSIKIDANHDLDPLRRFKFQRCKAVITRTGESRTDTSENPED